MAYVVTRPCRIGDGPLREPGEVLSAEELRGRNVRQMEDGERVIRFDPTVAEPGDSTDKKKPTRGRGKAAASAEPGDSTPDDE